MVFLWIYKTEITELKEEDTYEETSKIHVAQTEVIKQMSLSFSFILLRPLLLLIPLQLLIPFGFTFPTQVFQVTIS